jgi:hypothetical protein
MWTIVWAVLLALKSRRRAGDVAVGRSAFTVTTTMSNTGAVGVSRRQRPGERRHGQIPRVAATPVTRSAPPLRLTLANDGTVAVAYAAGP